MAESDEEPEDGIEEFEWSGTLEARAVIPQLLDIVVDISIMFDMVNFIFLFFLC